MIADAIEMRSSSMPNMRMMMSPMSMVMGTKEPTMSPVRIPRKSITTAPTMTSVW